MQVGVGEMFALASVHISAIFDVRDQLFLRATITYHSSAMTLANK